MSALSLTLLRFAGLLALFAATAILVQYAMNTVLTRQFAQHAINRRLRLLRSGVAREEITGLIRPDVVGGLGRYALVGRFFRLAGRAGIRMPPRTLAAALLIGNIVILLLLLVLSISMGGAMTVGVFLLLVAVAVSAGIGLPILVIGSRATRRAKRMEEQFPAAIDVFTRARRAGHPVGSAIALLTGEMEDPIGSEFGIVSDAIAYGADLNDALRDLADRWDSEDLRMFAVCVSVQGETGGNLAEILTNLSSVIRDRASLYLKVRALSSEGRMSAWMLSLMPVLTFLVLFLVNPGFYLEVARDPLFVVTFSALLVLYLIGVLWIRNMINLKV